MKFKNAQHIKRTVASALLAGLVVLSTTGCIKLNMDLTVDEKDTVSGKIIFAVSKSLSEYATQNGGETSGTNTEGLFKDAEGVKVEKFDDGDFVGSAYTFKDLPLEKMKPAVGDTSTFGIRREGDDLIVSGALDMGDTTSEMESNPFASAMMASFAASTDIKVSVTLPGKIGETTGTVEGQTITWKGKFGEKLEMQAVSHSPLPIPINWILVGGIGAAIIAGVVVLVVVRSRRGASNSAIE